MMPDDMVLVQEFAARQSEPAFTALVDRHIRLVYSAALRQTQDATLAEEVTQAVFVILAHKAPTLGAATILSAWFYRTTHYTAANALTIQRRRQQREQEAYMLSTLNDQDGSGGDADTTAAWRQLAPWLDDVMAGLAERDRTPLVLHYFENRPWREVGRLMRITEDAAQKRASRALEKLRAGFAKRGVAVTAGAIATAVAANSLQAVPVGLATKISAAALTGTVASTSTLIATTKAIAMTTFQKVAVTAFQKIAVTATLAAATGVGVYEARQAAAARAEVQTLQRAQASLQNDLEQVKAEKERLADQAVAVKEQNAMSAAQLNELLRLRGQAGQVRTALQDVQKMQAAAQSAPSFALPSNVMMRALDSHVKSQKANAVKTTMLRGVLNLTDNQARDLNEVLNRHAQSSAEHTRDMFSGKLTRAEAAQAVAADNASQEEDIRALLTPEQLSAYSTYQQTEAANAAVQRAGQQLDEVMQLNGVTLSPQQQEAVRQGFVNLNLSQPSDPTQAIALNGGDLTSWHQQSLDARLKVLEGVLTPDQLKAYQQNQQDRAAFVTGMLKMFSGQSK